ncbi:hypothetical protein C8R44DRAFT_906825 [Mycena epipterygia]|nr:hypothetical protein C8R44DRAFT_906825 [Mycena epipterygia]
MSAGGLRASTRNLTSGPATYFEGATYFQGESQVTKRHRPQRRVGFDAEGPLKPDTGHSVGNREGLIPFLMLKESYAPNCAKTRSSIPLTAIKTSKAVSQFFIRSITRTGVNQQEMILMIKAVHLLVALPFGRRPHQSRDVGLDSLLYQSRMLPRSPRIERSGSPTMLHIYFRFTSDTTDWPATFTSGATDEDDPLTEYDSAWPAHALVALVPYVARIEILRIELGFPVDATPLLYSNLRFPALKTLYLESAEDIDAPDLRLWLSAPHLRTLDIERVDPKNWEALLVPIACRTSAYPKPQCPLAWRVMLLSQSGGDDTDYDHFDCQPFMCWPAPTLRELELRMAKQELANFFKIGFSDVVLDKLTVCIYIAEHEVLTGVLLPGFGSLLLFQCLDPQQIELHDDEGHIRRLECWNTHSSFEVRDVWTHLSWLYDLHKTVREKRILHAYWDDYVNIFESYPPQSSDGVTLAIQIARNYHEVPDTTRIMRIPGLAKIEFLRTYMGLVLDFETTLNVLARI